VAVPGERVGRLREVERGGLEFAHYYRPKQTVRATAEDGDAR
jgi:hypothetical protein